MFPYLALLRVGFTKPVRHRTAGALLPHLFTLTGMQEIGELPFPAFRRYIFCGTFRLLRALALRGTLPCGVRTFLPQPKLTAITRLPADSYDFILFSNFCNSAGSGEWNSRVACVVGWVKRKAAAWRKYRFSSPNFLVNSL